jgi:AcrR family transcriptional regulator
MSRPGRSVQPRLRGACGRSHATRTAAGGRLSRAVVVDAALRIVDRDGLDGVSMRRLAAAIGATPMALYRHVPNKAALLDALVAAVLSRLEFPTGDLPWRSACARRFARCAGS